MSDQVLPDRAAGGQTRRARETKRAALGWALPAITIVGALTLWEALTRLHVFPAYAFPSLTATVSALGEEFRAGRLTNDITASLFRVAVGFVLAAALGIPLGLWLGQRLGPRLALQPLVNFFRCLSPLAWIPFAILWFGIGDKPAIFLIFMSSFFPLALATIAAVAGIPAVYYRVARDYGFRGHGTAHPCGAPRHPAPGHHRPARHGGHRLGGRGRGGDGRAVRTGWGTASTTRATARHGHRGRLYAGHRPARRRHRPPAGPVDQSPKRPVGL